MASSRPGILDEGKRREICAIVAVGGSRRTAAKYVGCAESTVRRTAAREPAFARRLKRAQSSLEVVHLTSIQEAAKKSWRASAWVLERVYPERYGKRAPRTITLDQLDEAFDKVFHLLDEEVQDRATRRRIFRRVRRMLAAHFQRQSTRGGRR